MEVPQRHHPGRPGRHRLPGPHPHLQGEARGLLLENRVPGPGKAELVFTDESGKELSRQTIFDFQGPGVLQGMHNRDDSILSFARCCFTYALEVGQDVWFSTKDTISKDYDQTFKLLFQKVYDEEFAEKFAQAGLTYRYALIDLSLIHI